MNTQTTPDSFLATSSEVYYELSGRTVARCDIGGRDEQTDAISSRIADCLNACVGINPEAVPDLIAALEMLVGDNTLHSLCQHDAADVLGRVKGTWSQAAQDAAKAALNKAKA